jgi:hypothetical protein
VTEEPQESFLSRAVSGALDATVGRVEDRVVATTQGVIDDLEPYLAEETVPRLLEALTPHLVERVVPDIIDGLTERLATTTGPQLVSGMTPELADELVPVLLERMRPYLVAELVPAVIDGITPRLIETTAPQIVDGLLPHIRERVVPQILDDFVDDPRVRDLIREQSLGLLWDALETLRRALARGDDIAEGILRRVLLRAPAVDAVAADELPPRRGRSHAGLITRSVGAGIDLALISLLAAQGLAIVVALLGAVVDPIPKGVLAVITFGFAMLGPIYLAVAWRSSGRSIGGAIAGYAVVGRGDKPMGSARALIRAWTSFFLAPVWAVGMLGTAFHPARRSWGDRLVGSRTPYLVHVERSTTRDRSKWH